MDPNEARCLLGPYQNNNSKCNLLKCKQIACLIIYSSIKSPYLMRTTKITLLILTTIPLPLNLTFKCEQIRQSFLMCHHITPKFLMHQNSTLVIDNIFYCSYYNNLFGTNFQIQEPRCWFKN